jgi:hypothetical protein
MMATSSLALVLAAFTPVQTAECIPEDQVMIHVDGGFALLRLGVPALPVLPVLTGELSVGRGIAELADLRVRYLTHLGLIHRLGPELRVRALGDGTWAVAGRLWATGQIVGTAQESLDLGGDVSTRATALATHRADFGAITAEAGVTVEWLVFEALEGRSTYVDSSPYLGFVELALGIEWPTADDGNLALRLEATVPTASDDPFTVLGVIPRLVFGGSFAP